jgi:hypothetical protein
MGDMTREAGNHEGGASPAEPSLLFHPLADELVAIADRLRNAAEGKGFVAPEEQSDPARSSRTTRHRLALARDAYALRRRRTAIFGNPDLFGEPAWDILLDLYIAQAEGKSVSVSSACIGSASPATTGLRWLGVLAEEGLIVRENDAGDHRRVLVRLTPAGLAAMDRYFDLS